MKRILLPAGGALLATGLLAAGLATSAQAESDVNVGSLVSSDKAQAAAEFWLAANGAALAAADEYRYDYKAVSKLVHTGGYSTDTKPGLIGEPKTKVTKVHNVNIPRTIGKVFFTKNGGKDLYWCSATSIQSNYKNLVATAGHCVYDVAGNEDVLENWVFVPGHYQNKAPYGVYVGKTAYTHSDFSVYEDYDRDYAFVTVYNGIYVAPSSWKEVTQAEWDAYKGDKDRKLVSITKAEYDALVSKYGPESSAHATKATKNEATPVGNDYVAKAGETKILAGIEVTKAEYDTLKDIDNKANNGEPCLTNGVTCYDLAGNALNPHVVNITKAEYDALVAKKAQGGFLGELKADGANWTKQQFYKKQWYITKADTIEYFKTVGYAIKTAASWTQGGRLGDVVGAQGFAWNQPTGKYVRTFGYPGAEHKDGSKPFSGNTPKWCYGKTSAKTPAGLSTHKAEELVALKCAVTPGYNGSPWLYQYSNAKRVGYVNGVTTAIYGDADGNNRYDTIFSPYFDGETKQVYSAAINNWSGNAS
ncbi:hypothetical protein [Nonomuraea soli]|uniref:Type II secretory pathway pseudopilin PulG n=1 Tax=Nonomuraea soli TaxID=1032476 RepID=A0A7W0CN54_9ACTN|nr:hypothetical protein [Nonomuraea soli]MBA2894246.1 type II secretory pathway pseudopilin PulG [Nonomuraea soli]